MDDAGGALTGTTAYVETDRECERPPEGIKVPYQLRYGMDDLQFYRQLCAKADHPSFREAQAALSSLQGERFGRAAALEPHEISKSTTASEVPQVVRNAMKTARVNSHRCRLVRHTSERHGWRVWVPHATSQVSLRNACLHACSHVLSAESKWKVRYCVQGARLDAFHQKVALRVRCAHRCTSSQETRKSLRLLGPEGVPSSPARLKSCKCSC